MAGRDVVVVGASAGGISALKQLLAGLRADLSAAVFVTLHMLNRVESPLATILEKGCKLPVKYARDGESIEHGRVYVAPPDYHLILHPGHVELQHGPRENLQRPCINVMFRSAATAYGERVTGVVLTGLLDDGAAGLWEIQRHGGRTVVQDPDEAAFRSMPDCAIAGTTVDHILPLSMISPLLMRLSMSDHVPSPVSSSNPVSEPSRQACPECGGVMKVVHYGGLVEYDCHIGHRLGVKTMIAQKSEVIEKSLSTAVCQTEELLDLLEGERPQGQLAIEALQAEISRRRGDITIIKNGLIRG